jgi:hypothetical protein
MFLLSEDGQSNGSREVNLAAHENRDPTWFNPKNMFDSSPSWWFLVLFEGIYMMQKHGDTCTISLARCAKMLGSWLAEV